MLPAGRKRNFQVKILIAVLFLFVLIGDERASAGENGSEDNILIFWSEGDGLKAVTLMCVRGPDKPVGIVAIPVFIRLNCGKLNCTISEAYGILGRQGVTQCLEQLFKIPIGGYLVIDQRTLDKVSLIIGPVVMNGKVTTMTDVFEGTYTDGEIEPQMEIRSLAARLVEPRVIVKVPQLVWVLSSEVKTNVSGRIMLSIYRSVEKRGPDILNKKALPGRDYFVDNRKHRDVPSEEWVMVLKSVVSS
ncbi:MAG: hypothetical protein K6U74_16610 [Firmicutes bacterium]|nr:hypothetical protein [Bacillota bacterium]